MTVEEFFAIALELADTEESTHYGHPAIKRKGRAFLGSRNEGTTVSTKLDWENRDRLLIEHPEHCVITPHFYGWPWLLVKLEGLPEELAREVIGLAWENAPNKDKLRDKSQDEQMFG
ncbi:MAG: hypothetical protein KDC26_08395 [Armatimonadetes bacterium]|nr:hypothetical protein [Armatimonadota bacterium]